MSAALRTWSQSSSQKAKWCSAPLGPLTIAMSCGEWRPFQPDPELVAVGVEDLLGHPEAEDAPGRSAAASPTSSALISMWSIRGGAMPGQAGRRDRRRVAACPAGCRSSPARRPAPWSARTGCSNLIDSPWPTASPRLTRCDLAAVLRHGVLQLGQVVLALDPEAEQVEPGPRVVAQPDRVVVLLVPALEVDRVLAALGQLQAQHLGVVGGGQLEVGGADVDVGKAQDSHGASRGLGNA